MTTSQLALNTVSLRGDFVEVLDAVAEAGFSNIEFQLAPVKEFIARSSAAKVVELLRERHLRCIGGFETQLRSFGSRDELRANHDHLVANARLLHELSGGEPVCLVVGTDDGSLRDYPDALDGLARAVAEVAERIEPFNTRLLIEFNWGMVKTLNTAAEVARRSGARNAGVLFDPAHYHYTASKAEHLTPETIALIGHVHVDDMAPKPVELLDYNFDRCLPGQGCLDLKTLFGVLEAGGYTGFFSMEMFSERLWSLPAREAAREMFQSLVPLCL